MSEDAHEIMPIEEVDYRFCLRWLQAFAAVRLHDHSDTSEDWQYIYGKIKNLFAEQEAEQKKGARR